MLLAILVDVVVSSVLVVELLVFPAVVVVGLVVDVVVLVVVEVVVVIWLQFFSSPMNPSGQTHEYEPKEFSQIVF